MKANGWHGAVDEQGRVLRAETMAAIQQKRRRGEGRRGIRQHQGRRCRSGRRRGSRNLLLHSVDRIIVGAEWERKGGRVYVNLEFIRDLSMETAGFLE